jgi:hypothetical protein
LFAGYRSVLLFHYVPFFKLNVSRVRARRKIRDEG